MDPFVSMFRDSVIFLALGRVFLYTVHMSSISHPSDELNGSDWQRYLDLIPTVPEIKSKGPSDSEPDAKDGRQPGIGDHDAAIFPDVFF